MSLRPPLPTLSLPSPLQGERVSPFLRRLCRREVSLAHFSHPLPVITTPLLLSLLLLRSHPMSMEVQEHEGGGVIRGGGGAVPFSSLSAPPVQNVNLGPAGSSHHHLRMHASSNGPSSYGGGGPGIAVADGGLGKAVGGGGGAGAFMQPPATCGAAAGLGLIHPALAMLHGLTEQEGRSRIPPETRSGPVVVAMEHLEHGDEEVEKEEEREGTNSSGNAAFHTDVLDFSGAAVSLHQVLLLGEGERLHPLLDFEGRSVPSPRECELQCYARLVPACDEYTRTKKKSRSEWEARQRQKDRPVFRKLHVNRALLELEKNSMCGGQRAAGSWVALGGGGGERGGRREDAEGEEDHKEDGGGGGLGRLLRVDQLMFCGNYKALSVVVLGEVLEANTANRSFLSELQGRACRPPASASFLDVPPPSSDLSDASPVSAGTPSYSSSSSSSTSPAGPVQVSLPSEFPVLLGLHSPSVRAVGACDRLQELLHEHLLAPVQERLSVWMAEERERRRKTGELKKATPAEEVGVPDNGSPRASNGEDATYPQKVSTESQTGMDHQRETDTGTGGESKVADTESSPASSLRPRRVSLSRSVDHREEGTMEGDVNGAVEDSERPEAEAKQKDAMGEEDGQVASKQGEDDELSVDYGSSPRTPSGKGEDEHLTSSLGEDEGKHAELPHTPSPRASDSVREDDLKTPSSDPTRDGTKEAAVHAPENPDTGSPEAEKDEKGSSSFSSIAPSGLGDGCENLEAVKFSSGDPSAPSLVAESSTSPSGSRPDKPAVSEQEEQAASSPQPPSLTIPVPPAPFWAEVLRLLSQIYEGITSPNDRIPSAFFRAHLGLPPSMLRLLTAAACGVLKTLVLTPASRISLRSMLLRRRGRRARRRSGEARTDGDKTSTKGEDGGSRSVLCTRQPDRTACDMERDRARVSTEEEWLSGGSAGADAAREAVRLLGLEGPVLEILSGLYRDKDHWESQTMSRKREDAEDGDQGRCVDRGAEEEPDGKENENLKRQPQDENQDVANGVEAPVQAPTDHPGEKMASGSTDAAQEEGPGAPERSEMEGNNLRANGEAATPSTQLGIISPGLAKSVPGLSSTGAGDMSAPLCLSFSLHDNSHQFSDAPGSAEASLHRGSLLLLLVMKTLRRLAVLEVAASQLVAEGSCELLVSMLLEVPVWASGGANFQGLTGGVGWGSEEERITARGWKVKVEAFKGLVVLVSHVAGMERLLGWDRAGTVSASKVSSSTIHDGAPPPADVSAEAEGPEEKRTEESEVEKLGGEAAPTGSLYSFVLGAMASQLSFSRYHLKRLAAILLSRVKLYHAVAAFQQASLALLPCSRSEEEGGSGAASSHAVSSTWAGETQEKSEATPAEADSRDVQASHDSPPSAAQSTDTKNGTESGKEKQRGGDGEAEEKRFLATFSFNTTRVSEAARDSGSKKRALAGWSLPGQLLERGDAWVEAMGDATRAVSLQVLHHTLPPSAVAASRDERVEMELFWPFACRPWSAAGLSLSFYPTVPMYLLSYARGRLFLSSLAFVARCLYTRVSILVCPNAADLRLLSALRGLLLLFLRCVNGPLFFASSSLHLTRSLLSCLDALGHTLLSRAALLPDSVNGSSDLLLFTSSSFPWSRMPTSFKSSCIKHSQLLGEGFLSPSFPHFSSGSSFSLFSSPRSRSGSQGGAVHGGAPLQTELLRRRGVWGIEGAGTPEDFSRQSGPADKGGFEGLVPSEKDEEAAVMALHVAAATRVHLHALVLVEQLLEGGGWFLRVAQGEEEEDDSKATAYVDVTVVQALTSLASCPGGREAVAAAFRLRQADLFLLHLFAHLVASLTRSPADGSSPEESKGEPAPQTTWTGSSSRPLDGKETGGVLPVGEDTSLSPRAGVSPQNAAPVVLMQLPGPSAELLVAVRSVFLLVWELMLEDTFATFLVVGGPYLLASLRPLAVVGGLAGSDGETSKADDREKESKDDLSDEGFGALTDPSPGSFVHVQKQCDWKTVLASDRSFFHKLRSLYEALSCLYFPSDASSSVGTLPHPSSLFLSAPCSLPPPPPPRVLIDAIQCTEPPCSLRILQATAAAAAAAAAGGSAGSKPSTAPTGAGPQETGVVGGAGAKASGASTAALLFGGIEGGQGAELIDIAWAPDLPDAKAYAALLKEPEKAGTEKSIEKPEESEGSPYAPGWEIPGDVPPPVAPLKALLASRLLTLYVRRCPHVLLFANAEDSSFILTEELPLGEGSKYLDDDDAGAAVFGGSGSLDEHGLTALERSVLPPCAGERQESMEPSGGGGAARSGEEFGVGKVLGAKRKDGSLLSAGQRKAREEEDAGSGARTELASREDLFSAAGLKEGIPIHSGVGRLLLTPEAQKALLSCLARCVASLAPPLGNLATMADWQVQGGSMYRWVDARKRTLPTARALLVLFYNVLHGLTCPGADEEEEESATGPLGYRNIELLQLLLLLVGRLLSMSEWVGGADWRTEGRAVVAALAASAQEQQQVRKITTSAKEENHQGGAGDANVGPDVKVKGEQEGRPSSTTNATADSGGGGDARKSLMSLLALLSPSSSLGRQLPLRSVAGGSGQTPGGNFVSSSVLGLSMEDEAVSSRWISGMEVSGHEELCMEIRLSLAWACRLFFLWFQNFADSQSFLVRHLIRFGAASVPELQHAALLLFTSLASFSAILPAAPHTFHILPSARRPPVCGGGVTAVELATAAKEAEKARKANTSEGLSATVAAMLPPNVTLSARVYSLLEMLTMQYRSGGGGESAKKTRNKLGLAEDPEALPLYFCCEIDLTDELEAAVSASSSASSLGASAVFGRLTMGDEGVVAVNESGVMEQNVSKSSSPPGAAEPLEDPPDLLRLLRETLWGSTGNSSGSSSGAGGGGEDDKGEGEEGEKNAGGEVAWLRKWQREAETIRVEELVVLVTLVSRSAVASSPSLHSLGVHAAALLAAHRFPVYSLLFECMDTLLDTVLQALDQEIEDTLPKQEQTKKEEEKQAFSKGEGDPRIRMDFPDREDDLVEVFAFVARSPATDCARHLCRLLLFIEHLVALQAKASSSSLSELQRLVSLPSTRLLQVCLALLSSPGLLTAAEAQEDLMSYLPAEIEDEHPHARGRSSSMELRSQRGDREGGKTVSSARSFSSVGPVAGPLLRCALRLATNILVSYQRLADLAKQAVENSDGSSGAGDNAEEQDGESIDTMPNHLGLVRKIAEAVCALCNRPHPKGPGGVGTLGLALGFLVALGSHPFTLLTATFDLPHHSTEALLLPLRGEANTDATAVAAGANSALRLAPFVQKTSQNVKAAAQNLQDSSIHLWLALASRLLLLVEMVLTHASHPVAPLFSLLQHDEEALPFWASLEQGEDRAKDDKGGAEGDEKLQETKEKNADEEAIDDLDIYEDLQPPSGASASSLEASPSAPAGASQPHQTSLPGSASGGCSLPGDASQKSTAETQRSPSHRKDFRGNLLRPLRAALQTLLSQCQLLLASSQLHGARQSRHPWGGRKEKLLQAQSAEEKEEREAFCQEERRKRQRILILARQAVILLSKTEDLDVRIGALRLEPPPLLLSGSSFFPSDSCSSTPSSRLRRQLYWGGEEAAWDVVAHCDALFNVAVRRAAALTDPLLPVPAAQPVQDASLRLIVDAAVMTRVLEGSQDWWCTVGLEAIRCQAQEDGVHKASEEDTPAAPAVPSEDQQHEKKGQARDDDDVPLWCSDPLLRFHVPFSVPPPVDCLAVAKGSGASLPRGVGHAPGFPANPAAAKAAAAAAAAAAVAAAVTAGRAGSQGRENAASDPFRSRAKASRRAPSKHVDDYEAAVPGGLTLQKKMPPPPPPPPPELPGGEEQAEPARVEEKETRGTEEGESGLSASAASGGGGKTRSEEKFAGQPATSEKPSASGVGRNPSEGGAKLPVQQTVDTPSSREDDSAFGEQKKKLQQQQQQQLGTTGLSDDSRRSGFEPPPEDRGQQTSQEMNGAFSVPDRLAGGGRGERQTTGGAAGGLPAPEGTQEPHGMTAAPHGGIQPGVRPASHQLLIQQQLQQIQRAAQAREIEQSKVMAASSQQPSLDVLSPMTLAGGSRAGESGLLVSQTVPLLTGPQQSGEQQNLIIQQQLLLQQQHKNLQAGDAQTSPQALGPGTGISNVPLPAGQETLGVMQPDGGMLLAQGQKARLEAGDGKAVGMAAAPQQLPGAGQQMHALGAHSFGSIRQLLPQQPQIAVPQQNVQQLGGIASLQSTEVRTTPDQQQLQGVVVPQSYLMAQGGAPTNMVIQHQTHGGPTLPQQQGMYTHAQMVSGGEAVAARLPQQQGVLVQQGGPGAFQVTGDGGRMAPSQAGGHLVQMMGRLPSTGVPGDSAGTATVQAAQQPFVAQQAALGLGIPHQPQRQISLPSSPAALPQHHAQVIGLTAVLPHQQLQMVAPGFAPPTPSQQGGLMAAAQLHRGGTDGQQVLGVPAGSMQAPAQHQINLAALPQPMNQPAGVPGGVLPQQRTLVPHSQVQNAEAMPQGGAALAAIQEQPQEAPDGNAGGGGLDTCPGWKEFAADGLRENMDVTKLAQNPELLKDPRIKSRFIRLLNRHDQIKNLFRMLGLDL